MRRCFTLVCVVTILLSFSGCQKIYTRNVYEITMIESEVYNHSVGNDWRMVYRCSGRTITSGERWTVPMDTVQKVVIDIKVTEIDQWPENGSGSLSVILNDGFETATIVTVTENKGRYKGNTAQWRITCRIALIDKI